MEPATPKAPIRKHSKWATAAAAMLLMSFFTVLPCRAQQDPGTMFDPEGGAIRINSDRMIMQTNGNTVEFTGNVHAVQGKTSIKSNKLKVFYSTKASPEMQGGGMDEDAINRIKASGQVTINMENTSADAETAVYTAEESVLELSGSPARLETSDSVITGDKITMYRRTGQIVVEGNKESRVEAIFKPAPKSGGAEPERPDLGRTNQE